MTKSCALARTCLALQRHGLLVSGIAAIAGLSEAAVQQMIEQAESELRTPNAPALPLPMRCSA